MPRHAICQLNVVTIRFIRRGYYNKLTGLVPGLRKPLKL